MAWYEGIEGIDESTTGFIKEAKLDALEAPQAALGAVRLALDLRSKVGDDPAKIIRLPDDGSLTPVYDKLGVPKEAAGYDFSAVKRADGSAPDAAFIEHVRSVAFENKMTPAQAVAYAKGQIGFEGQQAKEALERRTVANQTAVDELKRIHKQNYPVFEAKARMAAERMGLSREMFDAIGNAVGVGALMTQMYNLGLKMGETELLGGEGNPGGTPAYTPGEARAKREQLMNDQPFVQRFATGDVQAIAEIRALDRIIHNRVAAR